MQRSGSGGCAHRSACRNRDGCGEIGDNAVCRHRAADARKVIADLRELSKKTYVAPTNFSKIYIGLGDKDEAFAWLEKGFQQRDFWLTFLEGDPVFDSLRPDPRFQNLVRRIGLPH